MTRAELPGGPPDRGRTASGRTGAWPSSTRSSPGSSAPSTSATSSVCGRSSRDQRAGAGDRPAQRRPSSAAGPPLSASGSTQGEPLDDLLPEAFAVVREAGRRVARHAPLRRPADRRHGPAPGQDRRDEDRRGQDPGGHPAVYLNALAGKGVHVVTVNDYLARRDAEWMGAIYRFLGLTVGVIHARPRRRRAPGGLRLRHHLRHEQRVRLRLPARQHEVRPRATASSASCNYAIVDEVDSILIDEARTPLIISGPAEESTDKYYKVNRDHPAPRDGDATTRSTRRAPLGHADRGRASSSVEQLLGVENLYDPTNIEIAAPRQPGPAGAHALQARRRLHGQGRRRSSSSTSSPAG